MLTLHFDDGGTLVALALIVSGLLGAGFTLGFVLASELARRRNRLKNTLDVLANRDPYLENI